MVRVSLATAASTVQVVKALPGCGRAKGCINVSINAAGKMAVTYQPRKGTAVKKHEETDEPRGGLWPTTQEQAIESADDLVEILFPAVLSQTLDEWAELRRRCRLKALKRREAGRVEGVLQPVQSLSELSDVLDQFSPAEAFALKVAIRGCARDASGRWMKLMETYEGVDDLQHRWPAVFAKAAIQWLSESDADFEFDEYMQYRDDPTD